MRQVRVSPVTLGWTSFDGRTWKPLAFEGPRPTSEPGVSDLQSVAILPMGLLIHNLDGTTWFGTPLS